MLYEYLIQDEHGHIVYVADNKWHAKQIADVMQMKTGNPHFVDCVLAQLLDYVPINTLPAIPEQRLDPYQ